MALTNETLKADETLASLTDDQLTAIATLSKNDEEAVIGAKVGEIHGQYDQDVESITGIKRPDGVKTYDYVKNVLGDYKGQIEGHADSATKLAEAQAEVDRLKLEVANGGDAEIKRQLSDAQSELSTVKTQYQTDKDAWAGEKTQWEKDQAGAKVNTVFGKATAGLKFKPAYTEAIQKTLIDSAKAQVLATATPDWVGDDLVFRDDKGEIMRNKANGLNPFTAEELISAKLTDALDTSAKKKGGGTGPSKDTIDTIDLVDLAGAKTQTEADDIIQAYLMQIGQTRGSAAFAEAKTKIWNDNKIAELPIR